MVRLDSNDNFFEGETLGVVRFQPSASAGVVHAVAEIQYVSGDVGILLRESM